MKKSEFYIDNEGDVIEKIKEYFTPNNGNSYYNELALKDSDVVYINKIFFDKNKEIDLENTPSLDFMTVGFLKKRLYEDELNDLSSSILIKDVIKKFITEHISEIIQGGKLGVEDGSYCVLKEARWVLWDLLAKEGYCIFSITAWSTDCEDNAALIKTFFTRQEATQFLQERGPKIIADYFSELVKNNKLEVVDDPIDFRVGDAYINGSYNGSVIEVGLSLNRFYLER